MDQKRKTSFLNRSRPAGAADLPPADPLDDLAPDRPVAAWLVERQAALQPRPGWTNASKQRLLARLAVRPRSRRELFNLRCLAVLRSPALLAGLLLVLALLAGRSAVSLAASAPGWLPGDDLFPLKSFIEDSRLALTAAPARQADLHIEYARRRLLDAQALVFEGRYEDLPATVVDFDYHTGQALRLIEQAARQDPAQARDLAERLHTVLDGQQSLVALLAQIAPERAQADLRLALSIAASGITSAQRLLGGSG
ncbi:MAG: DUF5667 domain-containing protein [Chloroflexota bacterium]